MSVRALHINTDEAILDYAIETFLMLCLSQRTRDEDAEDSEEASSAESDGAVEDVMNANMIEEEKNAALRLKLDKVERLQRAFGEHERLVCSLQRSSPQKATLCLNASSWRRKM